LAGKQGGIALSRTVAMLGKMLTRLGAAAVGALISAPAAAASATSFCSDLGGDWDGQYCRTTVLSERNAVRDIKVALPADLLEDPVAGPTVRDYLQELVGSWKSVGVHMVQDSFGEENFIVYRRGDVLSVVFHEDYHADGPRPTNAYRTFTFDTTRGNQLNLVDLVRPGVDALTAISTLGVPFIEQALDQASPPHDPGTYPFVIDRWGPRVVYSGAYKAWALTPDELILYMPDYPVAHDDPINYTPGVMQWSMDGGTVEAHIPLSALASILAPRFGG
jgi:hypothetical protein